MMYDSFDTLNSQLYSDCVSASSTVSVRLLTGAADYGLFYRGAKVPRAEGFTSGFTSDT